MGFFAVIIGYCIGGIVWGMITKHVSQSRGYDGGFAWGFWLGLIGLIVVTSKPIIQTTTQYTPMYPNALPAAASRWKCVCGAQNSGSYCPSCRRTREEAKAVKKIACPHCGASNTQCFACNQPMKEAVAQKVETNSSDASTRLAEKVAVSAPAGDMNAYEALEKLFSLYERGILTEEEYTQKKEKILERI